MLDDGATSSGLRTSQGSASAGIPSAASSSAASWQRSTLRAQSTMFAPSSASAPAIWRPMPLPPPVTIAVLPLRSNSSCTRIGTCDAKSVAVSEQRTAYRAFIDEHILPVEDRLFREDDRGGCDCCASCAPREAAGPLGAHLPPGAGGTGEGFLAYADLNEEIGRVTWAQYVFNCQAPDAGNGEILHQFGTPEQRERWLKPLVTGDARSFFSMTEPDVVGCRPHPDCRRLRRSTEASG